MTEDGRRKTRGGDDGDGLHRYRVAHRVGAKFYVRRHGACVGWISVGWISVAHDAPGGKSSASNTFNSSTSFCLIVTPLYPRGYRRCKAFNASSMRRRSLYIKYATATLGALDWPLMQYTNTLFAAPASSARTARACNASNFFTVSPKSKVVEHPRFTGAVKTHIFFDEQHGVHSGTA